MGEKELVIKEKVEHSGLLDFQAFYGYAHSWLKEEDYGVIEEKYSEKVSGNSREITVEWKGTKKLSDYFKIELGIKMEVKELVPVEVEIDGKKQKMQKGKLSVEMKGTLVKDPDNKWESSASMRLMRDWYNKYIIPSRVDSMEGKVDDDVKDFKEQLKSFLELSGKR